MRVSIVSPLNIPDCSFWYDFTDASAVKVRHGKTIAAFDKSGSGRHLRGSATICSR